MHLYPPSKRVCARVAITLLVLVFCIVVAGHLPATHAAATFTVNSLLDMPDAVPGNGTCADVNGACTLRAAIQETNSLSGDDTINFSVTGTINLTGALPALSSNVTINGPGSGQLTVRRDIGGNYRIFQSSGTSSISGLTITNGRTPDAINEDIAPLGGGIWQTGGSLTLRDVVITGNRTGNGGSMRFNSPNLGGFGGFGGGIYATGTLTMTDCVISNNTTGKGGDGAQFGGSGGRGAGMYFGPGTLTMTNVVVSGNQTGVGGGPHSGNSGDGGGLWTGNDAFPNQPTNVTLNKVTVTDNSTATAVTNGDTGIGGGIVVIQGTMTMTDSTVKNNHTGDAPARSSGRGGGIFNNATLIIRNSLISGNSTGNNSAGSNNNGGGIASHSSLTLVNTTVSGNSTGADTAGIGGGVFVFNFATLINCTVTGNSTPGDHANGVGGFGAVITLANTIVAGNGDSANDKDLENTLFSNSATTWTSQGHNLIGNADGVSGFNGVGDQAGTTASPINPHLGPLADNGGPTLTHALLTTSTALDAGSNALAKNPDIQLETDQRGAARIADSLDPDSLAVVDIGAFEFHQTLEDISNKTTNEDTPITVTFGLGDNGPAVTSVTASSNNQVVVPNANLVVSGTGATRSLQITPAANQSGLTMITVTVNLSGGGSLNDTFTLNVNPVNDRPTFFLLGAPAVLEDSAAQTVNLVTNINVGPLETQTVSFTATVNTNPGLFAVAPAIDSSGTLTYTPAPNAFGDAIVTVVMKDNGGTANGGIDTSIEQAFTISITSVNDVPTFTKGANQTVNEDAGFQFVNNWATNVSQGPNESDGLSFQVTNNTNPGLFSQQPAVAINGLLTYVPASNASGSADITIVLKDTGGTANGGVDTSAPQTFTITVTPVNDAPLIGLQSPFVQTIQHTPLVFSAANLNGIGLSDVDAGADPIRVTLTATQGTLTLPSTAGLTFVTGDGTDDTTMTFTGLIGLINSRLSGLTFKPNNGFSGSASLQIIADDEGHNGTGGAKSTTGNISINVISGGRLSFNTSTYGVNETGGTATITVLRAGGTAGTTTVNYATSDGTATAGASCTSGVDYIPASGSFTWNNGDASVRQFTITICNDGTNENDETISLTLSNAGGTGSLGTQPTASLTIGNDDAPVLLTEDLTDRAIALDLVNQTRDPFSLTSLFNLGDDQHRRVSLFVWRLGLLPSDTVASVQVVARDDEGRTYDLPVEALNPTALVADVTQVVVRLPDTVIGAPRDLRVKVTLRGPGTNEAVIKIAAP